MKIIHLSYLFAFSFIPGTQANLINQWKLDDAAGTAATDSISGNNGAFTPADASGPQWETLNLAPAPSGSTAAVDFDGTGDHIGMTGYKGIGGTNARTMSAWVRTRSTASTQNRSIVSWGTNAGGLH